MREASAKTNEKGTQVEMPVNGLFITGTDTGVGKTYVAAGIAATLRRRNANVGVMKPAETGCRSRDGRCVPADALKLMKAARIRGPLSLVCPYRFKSPLAPSVAAEREGMRIEPSRIIRAFKKLACRHDFMIVEGAGGLMTPLNGHYTYLDLAEALGLQALVVSRPGLGAINHTLLTIAALRSRGIALAGIVINYAVARKPGLAEKTNPAVMEKLTGVRILGIISHGSGAFDGLLVECGKERWMGELE